MAQRGLYFTFTSTMDENHIAIEKDIFVMKFRPGRYFQGLEMYDASANLDNLFARIKMSRELTFSTPNDPLSFLSYFSSAHADQRVLGYAILFVKEDKRPISPPIPLYFLDYKVTRCQPLAFDFAAAMYFITIEAKRVA